MSSTFALQVPAEPVLTPEQLARITGRTHQAKQLAWLDDHSWRYELAADGAIIVGSLYASLRLAGVLPTALAAPEPGAFDLSQVR
jgi:hypothetical protein